MAMDKTTTNNKQKPKNMLFCIRNFFTIALLLCL